MRVAVFSDTHGNSIALDAVLADIVRVGGVDAHWFVGDAAAIGFDPVGTVERLVALPNLVAVHGNGDRRVATDAVLVREITERFIATAIESEAFIWRAVLADSEWTRDGLKAAGLYAWLAGLPLEVRLALPDGTRVLLVHASPGTDEGPGINVEQTDDELRQVLHGVEADLVFVGHTHQPLDRTVDGVRAINLGCVSNPPHAEKRAAYDMAEVRERLARERVPAWEYVLGYSRKGMPEMAVLDVELLEIQVEALFTHDAVGRIMADRRHASSSGRRGWATCGGACVAHLKEQGPGWFSWPKPVRHDSRGSHCVYFTILFRNCGLEFAPYSIGVVVCL